MIQLILGGARSGKSSLAEHLAAASGKSVSYIATATAGDSEMACRIARHRQQRPAHWTVLEEPLALSEQLRALDNSTDILLVDCLTLWLSNHLLSSEPERLDTLRDDLCQTLQQLQCDVILVSNEVGMGIVPMGAINRQFVDQAGWLNQAVARCADRVVLVVAGCPMILKGTPLPC